MSDSKGAAIDEQIMDIFMEAVALRITPKQYTDKILALLAQEVNKAKLAELENLTKVKDEPGVYWGDIVLDTIHSRTKELRERLG